MSKSIFPLTTFGELVDLNPTISLTRSEAHPFVAMEDVTPRLRYVKGSEVRSLSGGARFAPGDTLFARITPCLENGKIAQFDPRAPAAGFGSTEFVVLRAKAGRADPGFIFYLSRTDWVREPAIKSMAGASGRQRARNEAISAALVPNVPLPTQRRIASILGDYDDLIELNRRRIPILEEMAHRLYEEWFVRLRFPGYENHAMVETPDELVPTGWRIRNVGEIAAYLSRGISPKYDDDAATLVVGQKCIRNQRLSLVPARKQNRPPPREKLVQPGDILINSTGVGTLGRVAQAEDVPEGLTVDSHVTIVRPNKKMDRDFFGLSLLRQQTVFERLGAGATGQTELNRGRIAEVKFLEPPEIVQKTFGDHARPLRSLACRLARQSDVLITARDHLLPLLVSGELSVSAAEQELEAVA